MSPVYTFSSTVRCSRAPVGSEQFALRDADDLAAGDDQLIEDSDVSDTAVNSLFASAGRST
jgi:hypothetical protein